MARGKQVRPHLCPPGIVPLMDGHGRGLEGGQDDVVGRGQLYSDVVGAATVRSGGEPGGGGRAWDCAPQYRGGPGGHHLWRRAGSRPTNRSPESHFPALPTRPSRLQGSLCPTVPLG